MQKMGPRTRAFFQAVLKRLAGEGIPFLVGGGYAMNKHTGLECRPARDLDLFVLPSDSGSVLRMFERAGYRVEATFPHWLGKIYKGNAYVDVIFSSGNGVATVDEAWFEHAVEDVILGVPARISPVEEMIWSKAFVMERERYDGADVAHLLLAKAPELDWSRLLDRFGPNQLVLLSHIVLFLYIYPSEKEHVPAWIWKKLLSALEREREQPSEAGRVCRGALLSRGQFLNDLEQGFRDPRLIPEGTMSASDVTIWTDAAKQREEAV